MREPPTGSWETMTMNTRLLAIATLCRELAIPALALAWIVVFGSLTMDNTDAGPTVDRLASLAANAQFADKMSPIASDAAEVEASRSAREVDVASGTPEPFVASNGSLIPPKG